MAGLLYPENCGHKWRTMTLATQCPHCHTTFRVANDQLKLRGGLVRCGSCREVFNGIEHLVRPEIAAPVAKAAAKSPASSAAQNHAAVPATPATVAATIQPAASEPTITETTRQSATQVPTQLPTQAPAEAPTQAPTEAFTEAAIQVHDIDAAAIAAPAETQQIAPLSHPRHDGITAVATAAPEPERMLAPDAAVATDTGHDESAAAQNPQRVAAPSSTANMRISASHRVEAAIDGLEEDLRIAEENGKSAPDDAHHTPFGLVKPSIAAETAPEPEATQSPNVWHRHADVDVDAYVNADDDQGINEQQMARMTLMQVAGHEDLAAKGDAGTVASENDELDRIIDELYRKPWRGQKSSDKSRDKSGEKSGGNITESKQEASSEPDFVLSARRKQRIGRPLRGAMWGIGALLLVGALGQSAYLFRDQLAVRAPQLKPLLTGVCAKIGCSVQLPMKIDAISIDANELQALDPARNIFSLNLLLRNRSDTVQAWPSIELTLNDGNEKAIVRRVFAPRDYLSAATNASLGFGSDQEQPVKLTFELQQLRASGYRVYLFYP